jgi:DMSO/TMAO reductase YedYZ molybdopterin-dependent catalytic subunit
LTTTSPRTDTTTDPDRPAPPSIPAGTASVLGLLAVLAAVGFGQLVAALISPASSPVLAVGNAAIGASPEALTEFAKTEFGTYDKSVLLGGMAVVIAVIAASAGLAARHRSKPGVLIVAALGLVGFVSVVAAPAFALLDVIAPMVSLAVGVGVFLWLHRLAWARALASGPPAGSAEPGQPLRSDREPTSGQRFSRRALLVGSSVAIGVVSAGAGTVGLLLARASGASQRAVTALLGKARFAERAPAIPPSAAFPQLGTPSFVTSNADFYRVDVALRIPNQAAEDWRMRIHGMVDHELTLAFADLLRRPLVERTITMTCVSDPVGGGYISTANFIGVELRPILLEAGLRPGAEQLFTTSVDGWNTSTPTDVVMEPDRGALLAIGMNGTALPPEHGFPVRMVVPGLYGYVSGTKWLTDMEVTTFAAARGYWYRRGWAEQAPIKTESRIDRPKAGSSVPAGPFTCAGIAWSQPIGISKVEVRVDGGPWQGAELATEVNGRTWRMWRARVRLSPGQHTIQARATDRNGVTQTQAIAGTVPNGASGWPMTTVTAA